MTPKRRLLGVVNKLLNNDNIALGEDLTVTVSYGMGDATAIITTATSILTGDEMELLSSFYESGLVDISVSGSLESYIIITINTYDDASN